MGRKKKYVPDEKQKLLSPNALKLISPKEKRAEKISSKDKRSSKVLTPKKNKTIKIKDTPKKSSRKPPKSLKSPIKQRGRPKPQAKASAKLKHSSSHESLTETTPTKDQNNSSGKNSPPPNNNNNDISNNNNNYNEKKQKSPSENLSKKEKISSVRKSSTPSPIKENTRDKGKEKSTNEAPGKDGQTNHGKESPSVENVLSSKTIIAPAVCPPKKNNENPNQVKCKVCKQWFPNRYFQRKHMLMEHEDQLYECRVCSFNSVDPEKLKSHIIKLHVIKKEKSESVSLDSLQEELEKLIDKKLPRKVMMEDGVTLGRDVNSKMRYVCALCSRIYTSKYSLERHVRCHTLEKPYQCDVCDFTSSYREHMQRHMTSVHLIVHSNAPKVKYAPKKKRANEDDDSTEESEDKDSPQKESPQKDSPSSSSSSPPSSSNSNCEIIESNPPKRRRNILRERFECAVCGLRATHKTDLVEHIKNKHPNAHIESLENNDGSKVHLIVTMAKKPRPTKRLTIQCSYCFLIFHDTWKYKVHLRSHTGVKPFRCSLCDMRATSKMTVRDHIHRKHKSNSDAKIILRTVGIDGSVEEVELPVPWREFKCETCNEQFDDNYNLKLHKQKMHTDEFPFYCIVCSHKELTKAGMVVHCSTSHEDEDLDSIVLRNGKPFKIGPVNLPSCDFCNKVFPYRSQLNIHMKVHTGEKSFSCDHCDYKTNLKKYLINHVYKSHFASSVDGPTRRKSSKPRKK